MVKYNKFGNKKTEYNGQIYHSKKEAEYARILDMLRFSHKPEERVVNVHSQVRYPIKIKGMLICTYIADFVVFYGDGKERVIDVKGYQTDIYKLKKKLMKAVNGIDIVEV